MKFHQTNYIILLFIHIHYFIIIILSNEPIKANLKDFK